MPKKYLIIIIAALALFTLINPSASLDILAFLGIAFLVLDSLFGDQALLILLAVRPTIDWWRDFTLYQNENLIINLNAAISILLSVWFAIFIIKERALWKNIPLKTNWLLWLGWIGISFFYSYARMLTVTEGLKAFNLFALFTMAYLLYIKYGKQFKTYFYTSALIAAVIPIIFALYQLFTGAGMYADNVANRLFGTFAHPNIFATFCLFLLMGITHEWLRAKNNWLVKYKGETKLAIILLLVLIIFTYTRIVWISLLIFILLLALVWNKKIFFGVIAGFVGFYLLFYPLNNWLANNFNFNLQSIGVINRLTSRNPEADSIKWRQDLYDKIIPLYSKHPIIGYGYGSFPKVWNDNKGKSNLFDNTNEAHNDYLKILFEGGAVGLILFLALFASLLVKQIRFGIKNHWTNIVFIASIVVYLTLSLSDNMLHHTPVIWWLFALWGLWLAEMDPGL